jgi:hypothetical protein
MKEFHRKKVSSLIQICPLSTHYFQKNKLVLENSRDNLTQKLPLCLYYRQQVKKGNLNKEFFS